jgi:hypothetical protein
MLWVGRVLNNTAQLILQLNKSISSSLRKQKGCLDQEVYKWIRLVPSVVDLISLYCDDNGSNA